MAPYRVLIVDDDRSSSELVQRVLAPQGYDVDVAVDGTDALNKLVNESFSLIISDIDMPRMNGFELTDKVKHEPNLKSIPVVIVTYKEDEEDRRRGMAVGADVYMVKSRFDNETLLEHVARLLG